MFEPLAVKPNWFGNNVIHYCHVYAIHVSNIKRDYFCVNYPVYLYRSLRTLQILVVLMMRYF